jgi:hypothetical protein
MQRIEDGYRLMCIVAAPARREMENISPVQEHREIVSEVVAELRAENAVTLLPPGEKPQVLSPLGLVRKSRANWLDWVWLPMSDLELFVTGVSFGKTIEPPEWPVKAVRIYFSTGEGQRRIPFRDMCVHGGCSAYKCLS